MVDVGRTFGPMEVNVSAFGSEIDDPLVTRRLGGDTLVLENSAEPVRTWGTEMLARFRQGPLHLTATHAYLRSTESNPLGSDRREVPLTPRHSAGLVAAWEEEGRGRAGLEVYFTGRQELDENPYRSASESHVILGFLVDRRFGRLRVFLNAENILDTRQTGYDRLVRPAQTPDGRWITDVWAPLDGRSFNGGVWITF
jgi:iron complex outermembrane receptor protein